MTITTDGILEQIKFARVYTLSLLADVDDADWFKMPAGSPTHIAWQVGHIAMAEYGLALFRQRGRKPEDMELMSSTFRKQFSRGSVPDPDPTKNPSPAEIRQTFERVHAQAILEVPTFTAEQLNAPCDPPTAGPATNMGALLLCPLHEMIHAGQIGFLRRLLGKVAVR
jgi:hypothetical protein